MNKRNKVKSPSIYIALMILLEIQANNYIGKDGTEYHDSEIDQLIWSKESAKLEILTEKLMRSAP